MQAFLRINEQIQKIAGFLACIFLLTMFFFVVFSVASRELGIETTFSEEFTRYATIIMVFIGAGYVLLQNKQVSMDLIVNKFSDTIQDICNIIVDACSCIFFMVVLHAAFNMWYLSFQWNLLSETDTRFPLWIPQFSLPLGLALLLLQSFSQLLVHLISLKKKKCKS